MKIEIKGEIGWDTTAQEVKNKLKKSTGDITVEVNSVGGSVYQGIEIFNSLHSYTKGKVTTVNTSMAASMASYILLVGDTVKAYSNATYMIHNALTYAYGNAKELRKVAKQLDGLSNIIAEKYVSKTGKPIHEIKQMMDDETFLYGNEMLDEGFVDEIVDIDKPLPKEQAILAVQGEYSKCLLSSKEHCKAEGYNKDIDAILATMPSDEKIVNQKQGADMAVTKEEFDAIQAKYDASLAEKEKMEKEAKALADNVEALKADTERNAVIAFCGANRDAVSYAKEKEFLEKKATLADAMSFVMESASKEEPVGFVPQVQEKEIDGLISASVAKLNEER